MTYLINKSNGELLATLADGNVDITTSSIALIGRDSVNFGEYVNENFIKLLENFSSTTPPEYPLDGQLWFDAATGKLKIYDGSSFKLTGGASVSPISPSNPTIGDLWIDNSADQLHFWNGSEMVVVGPGYNITQGKTGIFAQTVIDSQSRSQVISTVMVGGSVVGIFAKNTFTPYLPISGFTSPIKPGFTLSSIINGNLNANSLSASSLILNDGTKKLSDVVVFSDMDNILDGSLSIQNNTGITVGDIDNFTIGIVGNNTLLSNNIADSKLTLRMSRTVGNSITSVDAITVDSNTKAFGIFNQSPVTTLDVGGDVTVRGNLYVTGAGLPLVLSIDATGQSNVNSYVISQLTILAPGNIFGNGTVARVHCTTGSGSVNKVFELISSTWTFLNDL